MARLRAQVARTLCAALTMSLLVAPSAAAETPAPSTPALAQADPSLTTGRVLVRWRAGADAADRADATADVGARTAARIGRLGVDVLRPGHPDEATDVAQELERRPEVAWAEPEQLRRRSVDASTYERTELAVDQAWAADDRTRGAGVQLAVIDDGVDPAISDLDGVGKVIDGGDCSAGTCQATGATTPSGPHGTAVAAVAAGEADGGGIVGAAPAATIVAYRVFPFGNTGASDTAIASALLAAAARPEVKVVNLSLGSQFSSRLERDTIATVRAARPDLVIVAAAGNDGRELPDFPAGVDGVLSVGASARASNGTWVPASFSNRGDVDVLAPGQSVTTWWEGSLQQIHGTSFAAPEVAGLAAGLAGVGVTGDRARAAIIAGAEAPNPSGYVATASGSGRADALTALNLATGSGAYVALSVTGGSHLANVVGRRTVEQLRFEPATAAATGAVAVTTTRGSVDAFGSQASTDLAAGPAGARTAPAGTLTRATTTLRAPATDVGQVDASLTAPGGGTGRSAPVRLTSAGNGPEGQPVEYGRQLTMPLAYGSVSSDIRTVNLAAGAQLSMTLATPDWTDMPGLLFVWEPATSGGVANPQGVPSSNSGWYGSGTAVFTAPRAGRYAYGFHLLEGGADGTYRLTATCATCTNPLGSLSVGTSSPFSPNGDHVRDTLTGSFTTTAAGSVTVAVRTTSGALVRTLSSAAREAGTTSLSWNGNNDLGQPAPQGTYRVHASVDTGDGNAWVRTADVAVDRTRPLPSWMGTSLSTVYPYPDRYRDTVELRFRPKEAVTGGRVDVFNSYGQRVWSARFGAVGSGALARVKFAGRSSSGRLLASGRYAFAVVMTDKSGLTGTSRKQGFGLDARRMA